MAINNILEETIIERQDNLSTQNPTRRGYHQSERLKKVHSVRICCSHIDRDAKMVTRIKRTKHFINRTGKLPERFVRDKNEIELYFTMKLVCFDRQEYFIEKYPQEATELVELVKQNLGRHWKSVDNLYSLRDFLFDLRKRPTQKEDLILYRTLYNLENDISCQWLKKKYKKTVQCVLRLAKECKD